MSKEKIIGQKREIEQVLLSADELKIYLSVGRSTAYRLLKQEDFPTVRIGRRIFRLHMQSIQLKNVQISSQQ